MSSPISPTSTAAPSSHSVSQKKMDYSISAAVDGLYPVNVSSQPGYFDLTVDELHPAGQGEESPEDEATRQELERRRYSESITSYTKALWEKARTSIERSRTGSVSSTSSSSSAGAGEMLTINNVEGMLGN